MREFRSFAKDIVSIFSILKFDSIYNRLQRRIRFRLSLSSRSSMLRKSNRPVASRSR